ncbi:hypothetical protein OG301_21360 [Streptomyces platensis]|uniref:hypothetical protein n=1 Tax=Streptomyces platensis TaxID=58346 RepID=UPI002E8055CE|nr:hypothetical protein [Streptomyces platensis]WTI53705.1 hypothetical protein OG301_21360 [Streptomyces platensis]WUB80703.1 hypothetical protein OG424_16815 [Streptomyces platensis]
MSADTLTGLAAMRTAPAKARDLRDTLRAERAEETDKPPTARSCGIQEVAAV